MGGGCRNVGSNTTPRTPEDALKENANEWGLSADTIARSLTHVAAESVQGDGTAPQDMNRLFLYAKELVLNEHSVVRKIKFDQLLRPPQQSPGAFKRLERFVATGETSPDQFYFHASFGFAASSFFEVFVRDHPEWSKQNGSFVIFRDHPDMCSASGDPKPHALVERFQ
jgi:hypothetical protein